jgi:hypothetical protein
MTARKKKDPTPPKVRHTWKIRPQTRVKPSTKVYRRSSEKWKKPIWVDPIDWFGDKTRSV